VRCQVGEVWAPMACGVSSCASTRACAALLSSTLTLVFVCVCICVYVCVGVGVGVRWQIVCGTCSGRKDSEFQYFEFLQNWDDEALHGSSRVRCHDGSLGGAQTNDKKRD